jgi:hypothetical protein
MAAAEFQWDDAVGLVIALLGGVLFAIALKAYLRTRTPRVLFFASAFGVFFAKGLLKLAEVFLLGEGALVDTAELLADLAILLLFFLGTTRS